MAPPVMRSYTIDAEDYNKTLEELYDELASLIEEDLRVYTDP
jgi:hypothetical protein